MADETNTETTDEPGVEEAAPEAAAEAPEEPATETAPDDAEAEQAEPAVAEAGAAEAATAEAADDAPEAEEPVAPQKRKRKRVARPERRQRVKPAREKAEGRKPITRLPKPEHDRGRSQERRGVVVSSEMDKTIVVRVETLKAHRRYKKIIRRSTKFHAHDEQNEAKVGDVVRIIETRPLSKTKRWRLAEIVEEAK
jgi:ribosomal protein uS17